MQVFRSLAFSAALAMPAAAQILYVDANVATGGNGSSWAAAYKDLGAALAAAGPGTTLWVASGAYIGAFNVPAGVTVLGGFVGDAQSVVGRGDPDLLARSFQKVTNLVGTGTGTVVTMGQGAVLDGIWVLRGQAGAPGGGGVLMDGVNATLRNSFIRSNNDSADAGAGLLVRNGAVAQVENSVFAYNGDASSGAAIDVDNATGTFINLTIDQNENSGIRLRNGANPTIRNCIFSDNGLASGGTVFGIDQVDTSVDPTVEYCIFDGNNAGAYRRGATVMTAAQLNGQAFASGNLDAAPAYNGLNDWRLTAGSPAVDAGHPTASPQRNQGLYDQPRRLDGDFDVSVAIDIGAAEFSNVTLTLPVDQHTHVHVGIGGTPGLPAFLLIGGSSFQSGLFVNPAGHLFVNPAVSILVPYFSIPTPAGQAINYPAAGVTPFVPTYWQALTSNGVGVNLSNPSVHVTNP